MSPEPLHLQIERLMRQANLHRLLGNHAEADDRMAATWDCWSASRD